MDRPNVVLLFQDQLRHDAAYDPALCATPTMDRLRREGSWFDRCYTPTGLCSPARSSVLTGLYPHGTGVLRNVLGPMAAVREMPTDVRTVAGVLRDAGYRTGYSGKWHLGAGAHLHGFDDVGMTDADLESERFRPFWGPFNAGEPTAFFTPRADGVRGTPAYNAAPVDDEDTPAWLVQDDVRRLLRTYADGSQPFFVMASFFEPHWPSVLPQRWLDAYDPASLAPWPNFEDDHAGKPATLRRSQEQAGGGQMGWDEWSRIVAYYFGSVGLTDEMMGRIVDELDVLGLAENTIVIATCDHGDMAGSHRMFNKGAYLYEETYRIPLVVRWPGHVPADHRDDGFVSLIDVAPTILDAVGVDPPAPVHGRSVLPVLRGEAPPREAIHCEYHGDELGPYAQRMLRRDHWKLIVHRDDPTELYDLAADPAELRNVADDPGLRELRLALEDELASLMEAHDDPLGRWPERLGAVRQDSERTGRMG